MRDGCFKIQLVAAWIPVLPGYYVVLAVGVVVAALGFQPLIASGNHGDSSREQKRAHEVSSSFAAGIANRGVGGFALNAMVEGNIVICTITIALAIGGVVLHVV